MTLEEQIEAAMWAEDSERLWELAPCVCCCREHTFPNCTARLWNGCYSGLAFGESQFEDDRAWFAHYQKFHGMSEATFYATTYTEEL